MILAVKSVVSYLYVNNVCNYRKFFLTLNPLTAKLSNLNFHSLEVVDRVSETQLQVSENSTLIIWRLKG